MLKRVCFAGAMIVFAAVPALADATCGSAPLAPAIPGASELTGKTPDEAHQVVLDALKGVKAYQASLATYRGCLKAQENADIAALDAATTSADKDKIAAAKQKAQATIDAENKTIDTEQQVVTDYMNLHNAYCKMGSGLAGCAR